MISKYVLPMLALLPAGCAASGRPAPPIPVVAEQRQCPAYPLPPDALMKTPVKTDFLKPTR